MNTELAKTLTTALVQFLDWERPEGTMCCSNTDCENIKGAFEEGEYDVVEAFIQKKLTRMTEFEKVLADTIGYAISQSVVEPNYETYKFVKDWSERLLDAAKKELFKEWNEDMKNEYARGKRDGLTIGYNKAMKEVDENRIYKYEGPAPSIYWPPCYYGGVCTNPFHDCINCPRQLTVGINTITGTSTAKVEDEK